MKVIITFLLVLFLTSCSNSDEPGTLNLQTEVTNACTAEDPLQVQWIQDLIVTMGCDEENACRMSLFQSEYEGETVFYTLLTAADCLSNGEITLYNCEGQVLKELNSEEGWGYLNEIYLQSLEGETTNIELLTCPNEN